MTVEEPTIRTTRFDLGDGLIMRWSTSADKDDLAELMGEAFRTRPLGRIIPKGYKPLPNDFLRAATRRVMSGHSAVMDPTDFAVVENTKAAEGELKLVAAVSLQRLPGYYGKTDLQFGVGELVATLPKYRNRGLVRRLFFDMIHPASEARGDVIQIIFGIPHFYLQFGYIHALKGRETYLLTDFDFIPKLADGEQEPFTLRTPLRSDLPYLVKMSTREAQNLPAVVGFHYDTSYWLYTAFETIENAESYHDGDRMSRIVVDRKTGRDVGLVIFSVSFGIQWDLFTLTEDVDRGITYREAMFPILRQIIPEAKTRRNVPLEKLRHELKHELEADEKRRQSSDDPEVKFAPVLHPLLEYSADCIGTELNLALHATHPVRQLLEGKSGGKVYPGHKVYTRINSYPKFLAKVAPTLEGRLAMSPMAGLTATILINFYRITEGSPAKGLKICFVRGKLVSAEDWCPLSDEEKIELDRAEVLDAEEKKRKRNKDKYHGEVNQGSEEKAKPVEYRAMFPPLVFTRLVLGEASFEQLKMVYEDAYAVGDECKMLLRILFPVVDHHPDSFWW
ncbi:hypothetical protein BGW42_007073 [Actinomortierella wolfii]|nr:hypothetical protein BGW42_007073 [Actinomortierella wolfii]